MFADHWLWKSRATAGMKDQERIPLGFVKRLVVRKRFDPLGRKPFVDGQGHDSMHVPLLQPCLHNLLVRLVEPNSVAFRMLKQIDLAFLRVARGDKQGFVSGLDGAEGKDEVAHIVGANEGDGWKGSRDRSSRGFNKSVGDAVDGVGSFGIRDHLPAIRWRAGAWDKTPLSIGLIAGAFVDNVHNEATAIGWLGGGDTHIEVT